jgi:pyruvate dehydrogenase E2 component (dihydrolipoamide acetyltransferase)
LTEAEIVRWLVAVGDEVRIDQAIVEVETAKSLVEVPSPFAGSVATLHGTEGATLEVGSPLITVDAPGGARESEEPVEKAGSGHVLIGYGTPEAGSGGGRRRRRTGPSIATASTAVTASKNRRAVPLVVSPLVRNLARDRGVDLRQVEPTGPGGVIVRADVENAAAPAPASSTEPAVVDGERRLPLSGFRKAVSATLSRSRAEIPEATVWVDVDATALWELRESARTAQDAGPGVMAYLARFVVAALREYPVLNARLDVERQEIVQLASIDLGIAVQSERGLVVPAVMAAQTLTTSGLDAEIRAVTQRAREGRSRPAELTAGTFTLNNYGSFRVDGSAAIINHPQVAILGFGRIIDRPWVVDGEILPRKITQMSFVFDHRVCDGGTAAGFMRSVADAVENPAAAIARL